MRITFDRIDIKRDVLSNAKKLRDSEDAIAVKLFINPDLTEKQRKIEADLRKEMWDRRTNHGENVAIKKGKIVTVDYPVRKERSTSSKTA